jgi:hypothetical protein
MTINDHNLSLRLMGESDYSVIREGRAVGRMRLADERPDHEMWEWAINPPLPVPSWGVGRAASLEDAKMAFGAAWERFYARLSPADLEHWHKHQDGVRERH